MGVDEIARVYDQLLESIAVKERVLKADKEHRAETLAQLCSAIWGGYVYGDTAQSFALLVSGGKDDYLADRFRELEQQISAARGGPILIFESNRREWYDIGGGFYDFGIYHVVRHVRISFDIHSPFGPQRAGRAQAWLPEGCYPSISIPVSEHYSSECERESLAYSNGLQGLTFDGAKLREFISPIYGMHFGKDPDTLSLAFFTGDDVAAHMDKVLFWRPALKPVWQRILSGEPVRPFSSWQPMLPVARSKSKSST